MMIKYILMSQKEMIDRELIVAPALPGSIELPVSPIRLAC